MPFLSELNLRSKRETDTYVVTQVLIYDSILTQTIYYVHAGFETDFASVPRMFQRIVDEDGGYIRDAAVVHDWLYTTREVKRPIADKILKEAMLELGASKWQAWAVYYAVRLFGGSRYAKA